MKSALVNSIIIGVIAFGFGVFLIILVIMRQRRKLESGNGNLQRTDTKHILNGQNLNFLFALFGVVVSLISAVNVFPNITKLMEVLKTEESKLSAASYAYDYKDYKELYTTYATMLDNPIALNNIGYMYSKGLIGEKSIAEAEKHYKNAYIAGCDTSLYNLLCLYYNNDYESDFMALIEKYKGSKVVIEFVGKLLNSFNVGMSIQEFLALSDMDRTTIIDRNSSDRWSEQVYEYDYIRSNVNNETFSREYIGSEVRYTSHDISGLKTYYKYLEKTKLKASIIDNQPWFDEEFIKISYIKDIEL